MHYWWLDINNSMFMVHVSDYNNDNKTLVSKNQNCKYLCICNNLSCQKYSQKMAAVN